MARAGTAYVDFAGNFAPLLAQSKAAGVQAGAMAGSGATAGLASAFKKVALPAAVIAAGAGFAKLGKSFQDSFNTIRVGTGATGEALRGLEKDFKAVAAQRPTGFNLAADAIADLNTRLGLTGKPLQDLSVQFLRLSSLTKTDLQANIASVTRAFGDWEVATRDQGDQLDFFFRAAQASGASVEDLASKVVQFGAPLRQVGFSIDEATAMFALFEKAGVNVQTMMPGLRQALRSFLEDGRDPAEALRETFEGISSGAIDSSEALKIFGARAGADMIEAIKQGRFDIEEFTAALNDNSETIQKAAEDTSSLSGKLGVLKNKVLIGLEPIATRVYGALNDGIAKLVPIAGTAAGALGQIFAVLVDGEMSGAGPFGENSPFLQGLLNARDLIVDFVSARLQNLRDAIGWVAERVMAIDWQAVWDTAFGAVITVVNNVIWAWESVKYALSTGESNLTGWVGWLQDGALAVQEAFSDIRGAWDDLVAGFRGEDVDSFAGNIGSRIGDLRDDLGGLVDRVREIDWGQTWENITSGLSDAWERFGSIDGLRNAIDDLSWEDIRGSVEKGLERVGETALADWAERMWDAMWAKVVSFEWGDGVWAGLMESLRSARESLGGAFDTVMEVLAPAREALGEFFSALGEVVSPLWDLVQALGEAFAPVLRVVWPILRTLGIAIGVVAYIMHRAFVVGLRVAAAVISWVADKILPALTWYATNVVTPAISAMVEWFLWGWSRIRDAAVWAWDNVLRPTFEAISWVVTNVLIPAFQDFVDRAEIVWEAVQVAISTAWAWIEPIWNTMKTVFGELVEAIGNDIDSVVDFFTGLPERVSSALSTIADVITFPFRTAFNAIADIWNATIGGFTLSVPDVPGLPMRGQTISFPEMPTFHKGGIVPGMGDVPIMAQGGELVIDKDTTDGILRAIRSPQRVDRLPLAAAMRPADLALSGSSQTARSVSLTFNTRATSWSDVKPEAYYDARRLGLN